MPSDVLKIRRLTSIGNPGSLHSNAAKVRDLRSELRWGGAPE
jgi:hypothetical protein